MDRKGINFILLSGGLIVAILISYILRWHIFDLPFASTQQFNYPSYAITDNDSNIYVIDTSLRRVVKLDSRGQLLFVIEGGQREEGTFFYAADLAVDNEGNLYVLNWLHDEGGFHVEKEEILQYSSDGQFRQIIYSRPYEKRTSTRVQRGQLNALSFIEDKINWFDIASDSLTRFTYDGKTGSVKEAASLSYPEANIFVADVAVVSAAKWAVVNKKGQITLHDLTDNSSVGLYNADDNLSKDISVPLMVEADAGGGLYYSDIGTGTIQGLGDKESYIFSDESLKKAGFDVQDMVYYRFDINGDVLTTFNDYGVVQTDLNGTLLKYYESIQIPFSELALKLFSFIMLAAVILILVLILRHIYLYMFQRTIPPVLINALSILFVIGVTTLLVVTVVLKNFAARYTNSLLEKTQQMAQLIPQTVDGDLFNQIQSRDDYMGDAYRKVRASLHAALNENKDPWNDRYYFVLYSVIDEKLYGMMYLNDRISMYHPFNYYEETDGAYRLANSGEISAETDTDSWGTWIYAVSPIRDSKGKVVALLEVGTDFYSYEVENRKLFKNLILDVGTLVIVFVLILIEFVFYLDLKRKQRIVSLLPHGERRRADRRQSSAEAMAIQTATSYSAAYFVRPVNFLITLAISMSVAFVPVMMRSLYQPVFNLSEDIIIALPISLEMLFFAVGLITGGSLSSRGRWKHAQVAGIMMAAGGLLLSALSVNMYIFFVARSFVGFGSGLILISLRSIVSSEKDSVLKSHAYAHFYAGSMAGLNVGVFFGAFLADQIGFYDVFYVAFALAIISGLLMVQLLFGIKIAPKKITLKPVGIFRFIIEPKVILFFLFVILPTYTAGMFLVYYFPLFATEKGLSVSDVGRFFIVNGLFVIYLGPTLSRLFKRHLSDRVSLLAGSAGWAIAMAFFALTGNIAGAVATVIVMGIVEGFAVTAQNDYYLNIGLVKKIGEERAVAYFEVAAKIAEMAAPILFGAILILGPLTGIGMFSVLLVVMTLVYIPISAVGQSKDKSGGETK